MLTAEKVTRHPGMVTFTWNKKLMICPNVVLSLLADNLQSQYSVSTKVSKLC
jgi:hypothetical protein